MGGSFVYSFFAGAALLLFPVFLYTDAYADLARNRVWFCISFYHKIKLFGGYAELRREGILFHLTKKKAVLLPFAGVSAARKRFEITKGFQLVGFHQIVETDGANAPKGVMIAAAVSAVTGAAFCVLRETQGVLSLKSRVLLHREPCLKLSVRSAVAFNGLTLAIALLKKALEVFLAWIQKKRSTRSCKKRRKGLRGLPT